MTETLVWFSIDSTEFSHRRFRYIGAMRNHLFVCILSLLLGSCVSVQLPGGKVTPAKGVEYTDPSSPFKDFKASNADKAWISEKTGNTISYLSECGGSNEPSLQQIESDSLSAITDVTVDSHELMFNGRAARQSVSRGKIDGVPVKMELLVFKKNGCNYTLSYGGVEKQFETEQKYFEKFKENFKAP